MKIFDLDGCICRLQLVPFVGKTNKRGNSNLLVTRPTKARGFMKILKRKYFLLAVTNKEFNK
jgi:hypothetical protein